MQVEINEGLLQVLRRLAQEQGRSEEELLQEAVLDYLNRFGLSGSPLAELIAGGQSSEEPLEKRPRDPFLALIDRMSSRFDLRPEEAMKIAVEEQHAFRSERSEREEAER